MDGIVPAIMRIMKLWIPFIWAAGCGVALFAQPNQWPAALAIPQQGAPADSLTISGSAMQTWYENSFTSKDKLAFTHADSQYCFQQNADYELAIDTGLGKQNEYLSLYGSFKKLQWPLRSTTLGLDWRPIVRLNSGRRGSALMGIGELGPVASMQIANVPLQVRSGIVATGWNDSLPDRLTDAHWRHTINTSQSDVGFYGGFTLGDPVQPLAGLPLFLSAGGYGRVTDSTSRLVTATGSLLFAQGLSSTDSIFFYYTDSISSGREGFLADMSFINANPKTARSLQVSAGVKGKKRFYVTPALIYNLAHYSINYPDWLRIYNDKRNTINSLQGIFAIDTLLFMAYCGGIKFDWEREDKLYRARQIGQVLTKNNADSLSANLRDFRGFRAAMSHELSKEWESGVITPCQAFAFVFDNTLNRI